MTHPMHLIVRAHNLAIAAAERSVRSVARSCPCCGWRGFRFRTFGMAEYLRTEVVCPGCGSFERHRALALFYPVLFARLGVRPGRLIHCAPEPSLRRVLASLCDRYETSAFGEQSPADHRLDLRNIDLPDESCDAFVLNHVLDCMPGDRQAIAEMFRVLRPGGLVLAVVTLEQDVDTHDVPVAPNSLHRVYGTRDLAARVAPFDLTIIDGTDGLSPQARRVRGIPASVPMLLMRRPSKESRA